MQIEYQFWVKYFVQSSSQIHSWLRHRVDFIPPQSGTMNLATARPPPPADGPSEQRINRSIDYAWLRAIDQLTALWAGAGRLARLGQIEDGILDSLHLCQILNSVLKNNKKHNSAGRLSSTPSSKGTVSRDGFGFWLQVWLVLGLNRGWIHFLKFFWCSNDFITQEVYF
jgi:hypothetical protein